MQSLPSLPVTDIGQIPLIDAYLKNNDLWKGRSVPKSAIEPMDVEHVGRSNQWGQFRNRMGVVVDQGLKTGYVLSSLAYYVPGVAFANPSLSVAKWAQTGAFALWSLFIFGKEMWKWEHTDGAIARKVYTAYQLQIDMDPLLKPLDRQGLSTELKQLFNGCMSGINEARTRNAGKQRKLINANVAVLTLLGKEMLSRPIAKK